MFQAKTNVTVTVLDANDNNPEFNQTIYQMNVTEGEPFFKFRLGSSIILIT